MTMMQRALEEIKNEWHKRLDMVAAYTAECTFFEKMLPQYLTYKRHETYWELGTQHGSLQGIYVQHHMQPEERFSDHEALMSAVLDRGYTIIETSDVFNMAKEYAFKRTIEIGGKEVQLLFTIRLWPAANSQYCKKVEVGMEPKYELRCE